MVNIDLNSSVTIHEQLVTKLSQMILTGALGTNEKLPSVRKLASVLVVNPHTINKAYAELEQQGLIECEKNKGYFVKDLVNSVKQEEQKRLLEQLEKDVTLLLQLGLTKEQLIDLITGLGN